MKISLKRTSLYSLFLATLNHCAWNVYPICITQSILVSLLDTSKWDIYILCNRVNQKHYTKAECISNRVAQCINHLNITLSLWKTFPMSRVLKWWPVCHIQLTTLCVWILVSFKTYIGKRGWFDTCTSVFEIPLDL